MRRFERQLKGRSPRQRCHAPETAEGSSIRNIVLKTLCRPALLRRFGREFSGHSRASAAARRKQRDDRRFHTEFAGRSTRQRRCRAPKTTRRSLIASRILRTLYAPVLPPADNSKIVVDSKKNFQDAPCASTARRQQREGRRFQTCPNIILRPLHSPALPSAENSERVVNSEKIFQDAPRASAGETAVDAERNSQNAPHASAATRRKQGEGRMGRRFKTEFARCSTRQRGQPPKTARGFAIHVPNSHGAKAFASHVENSHGATA